MIEASPNNKYMIEKNFSRYAHLYDRYANIQRMAAHELMMETDIDNALDILEIGCGTGYYTLLLRERFKMARIAAVDISMDMIKIASQKLQGRQIEFLTLDAEELDSSDRFDLITSNAAFQWFDDLEGAMARYRGLLTERGAISFSIFGPLTFCELGGSLKEAMATDIAISADNFLDRCELDTILKRHFSESAVKELLIKEKYLSLKELLDKIKYTGSRGNGVNNLPLWKRDVLDHIEDIYKMRHGQIVASYQILFCKAAK